jgi:glucan phosphoethanolaminetransferase (alkaline phosphatase superfamily)
VDSLPDSRLSSLRNATLFQIAKARGYKTVLIDLQNDFPNIVIRKSDMVYVDEYHSKWTDFASERFLSDIRAAGYVRRRLIDEKGLFVVLMKLGVHIPYEARYPGRQTEHQVFVPKLSKYESHSLDNRLKIAGSYKNALRYNVDGFFSGLLGEDFYETANNTILWTSDHGQSLQEDGQLETHNTNYLEQALVPFVVFSTDPWVLSNIRKPEEIGVTLSHMDIYPSVSAILNRQRDYSPGQCGPLFSGTPKTARPLRVVYESLWNGKTFEPPSEAGRVKLRTEKYLY